VSDALPLAGRVALIAGAAGPLGRAIAVALAEAGAELVLTTSTRADAEEFAINSIGNELWALDRRYLALVVDLDDPASIAEALRRSVSELGRLDVVIADAGSSARADRLCRAADEAVDGSRGLMIVNLIHPEADSQRSLDLTKSLGDTWQGRAAFNALQLAPDTAPAVVADRVLSLITLGGAGPVRSADQSV